MPDTTNQKPTADENQQSPSNHSVAMDHQDTNVIDHKENANTKEPDDDTIYENMIFPS